MQTTSLLRSTPRLVCALLLLTAFASAQHQQTDAPQAAPSPTPVPKKANARPQDDAAAPAEPFDGASVEKMSAQCVRLETEVGLVEVELFPESAPESVRGFLNLAATGALDTTTFSRVVKGFVVQGGNLSTRETLTPELVARMRRRLPDEPSLIKHERGILSMARGEEPNSASTHFFILVSAAQHLDGKFSAFGRVRSGMEVVDAINGAPTDGEKPTKPVRITSAQVFPCAGELKAPPRQ